VFNIDCLSSYPQKNKSSSWPSFASQSSPCLTERLSTIHASIDEGLFKPSWEISGILWLLENHKILSLHISGTMDRHTVNIHHTRPNAPAVSTDIPIEHAVSLISMITNDHLKTPLADVETPVELSTIIHARELLSALGDAIEALGSHDVGLSDPLMIKLRCIYDRARGSNKTFREISEDSHIYRFHETDAVFTLTENPSIQSVTSVPEQSMFRTDNGIDDLGNPYQLTWNFGTFADDWKAIHGAAPEPAQYPWSDSDYLVEAMPLDSHPTSCAF
jgi:hypothetical protein